MPKQQIADASQQLRDIKPLVEIADSSIYIFWGIIVLGIAIIAIAIFVIIKRVKSIKQEKLDRAAYYLKEFNKIDWKDSKESAYRATHYGLLLATDLRRETLYSRLLPLLEQYKYRKDVDGIDYETNHQFSLYRQVCNESV
jgi:hypothetical protein